MVSCGGWHTMAVTAAGHVWTCGYNDYGQLGVGDKANRLGFTQVDAGHCQRAARGREDHGGVRMVSQRGGVGGGARVDLWLWILRPDWPQQ